MRLIFLGAPGAGKGTQSQMVSAKYEIPQISTGDILRESVKNGAPLGKEAQQYMTKGLLVPDEIILGIIDNRLQESDCAKGYILDGFPRTLVQAQALSGMLELKGSAIDCVLNIDVDEGLILRRLCGRRVCSGCGESYHIEYKKPRREGVCDNCAAALYQRKDDREDTIKERLKQYLDQTSPLIDYYGNKGVLRTVAGDKDIKEIFNDIDSLLSGLSA